MAPIDHQGGKRFGELKKSQEGTLESICAEFQGDATPEQLESYKKKFMEFDVNNSGDLCEFEVKMMLEKLGTPKTHLECRKMIAEVDTVGKGTINFRDFLTMMTGKKNSVLRRILMFEELARSNAPQQPQKGPPPKKTLAELIA